MPKHPYSSLPSIAFWRAAVAEVDAAPSGTYCTPKWRISTTDRIATAGSCFAQHLGCRLQAEGFNVLDFEPAPKLLAADRRMTHGYGIYSARYGNIYTARQMLQLAQEALGERPMSEDVWEHHGRYVDALRPTVDPEGHATPEAVLLHRRRHLTMVRRLLEHADLLVFTLGLTETWEDRTSGRVYPVCPGAAAGTFDPLRHAFRNLTFQETLEDLIALRALLHKMNRPKSMRMLLTVSPVPLAATASGRHVMQATIYSKSILRGVAGQMTDLFEDIDYFPSYEIVSSPWTSERNYASDARSVTDAAVARVMGIFMEVHSDGAAPAVAAAKPPAPDHDAAMAVKCDEELLEAFGPRGA